MCELSLSFSKLEEFQRRLSEKFTNTSFSCSLIIDKFQLQTRRNIFRDFFFHKAISKVISNKQSEDFVQQHEVTLLCHNTSPLLYFDVLTPVMLTRASSKRLQAAAVEATVHSVPESGSAHLTKARSSRPTSAQMPRRGWDQKRVNATSVDDDANRKVDEVESSDEDEEESDEEESDKEKSDEEESEEEESEEEEGVHNNCELCPFAYDRLTAPEQKLLQKVASPLSKAWGYRAGVDDEHILFENQTHRPGYRALQEYTDIVFRNLQQFHDDMRGDIISDALAKALNIRDISRLDQTTQTDYTALTHRFITANSVTWQQLLAAYHGLHEQTHSMLFTFIVTAAYAITMISESKFIVARKALDALAEKAEPWSRCIEQ